MPLAEDTTIHILIYTWCKSVSFKSKLIHSFLVNAMLLFEEKKHFTFESIPVVNLSVSNQIDSHLSA